LVARVWERPSSVHPECRWPGEELPLLPVKTAESLLPAGFWPGGGQTIWEPRALTVEANGEISGIAGEKKKKKKKKTTPHQKNRAE